MITSPWLGAVCSGVVRSVEIQGADHNSVSNSPQYEEALVAALR